MPRCKKCKEKFEARFPFQKHCTTHTDCINAELEYKRGLAKKSWNKKKKAIKETLKTNKDYLKELQVVFNKFIRLRDEGKSCISCQRPAKTSHCGHYRSSGGNPELRFNELNCSLQCAHCNLFLHGNLIDYRINLIKKIGIEKVEWLEGSHPLKKYSTSELLELKEVYKKKIKEL